jgi:hypothetical protein
MITEKTPISALPNTPQVTHTEESFSILNWLGKSISNITNSVKQGIFDTGAKTHDLWINFLSFFEPPAEPCKKVRDLSSPKGEISALLDTFNLPETAIDSITGYLALCDTITISGKEQTPSSSTALVAVRPNNQPKSFQKMSDLTPFLRSLSVDSLSRAEDNFSFFRIAVEQAKRLQKLEIKNTQAIPIFTYVALGKLPTLSSLRWINSSFLEQSEPNCITRNQQFDYSRISFPKLTSLYIENPKDKDLALLLKLAPKVQSLTVKNWTISDEGTFEIAKLASLQTLDLAACKIAEDSQPLSRFSSAIKQIQTLTLYRGDDLEQFGELPALSSLTLHEVHDDNLAWISVHCPKLREITILTAHPSLKLTADGLLFLQGMNDLKKATIHVQDEGYYKTSLTFMEVMIPALKIQ